MTLITSRHFIIEKIPCTYVEKTRTIKQPPMRRNLATVGRKKTSLLTGQLPVIGGGEGRRDNLSYLQQCCIFLFFIDFQSSFYHYLIMSLRVGGSHMDHFLWKIHHMTCETLHLDLIVLISHWLSTC